LVSLHAQKALLRLPAVGDNAAMEAEPPKADTPKRKRRRFQFHLRTLLPSVRPRAARSTCLGEEVMRRYQWAEWTLSVLVVVMLVTEMRLAVRAQDSRNDESAATEVEWPFPVAFSGSGGCDVKDAAQKLAKVIDSKVIPIEAKENPGCVIWVEKWLTNPVEPGYLIIVQRGGARMIASDKAQLDAAVARIESERRLVDGRVYLPLGVMTNFRVVPHRAKGKE
jgi:hypothetical protein